MPNQDQVAMLKRSVAEWNAWRLANQDEVPDLRGATLRGANLAGATLAGATLAYANLRGAEVAEEEVVAF